MADVENLPNNATSISEDITDNNSTQPENTKNET